MRLDALRPGSIPQRPPATGLSTSTAHELLNSRRARFFTRDDRMLLEGWLDRGTQTVAAGSACAYGSGETG